VAEISTSKRIIRSRAPLRLGLAGGGTDVSPYCDEFGGCVLNATIDLYAYCTVETRNDQQVHFNAVDINKNWISEATPHLPIDETLALHKGVYNRIVRDFNRGKPLNITLTTHVDAPPGSGVGSSSTLVVAMLKALLEYTRTPLTHYELAKLAFEIERIDLKLNGGHQDQYAATFGGFNFIEFYANHQVLVNPLLIANDIKCEFEASIILYFDGISRDSASIIDQQVENLLSKKKQSLDAMQDLKEQAIKMKSALQHGKLDDFAKFMRKSWEAKKNTAAKVTNPRIDEIYAGALEHGALAGKISGAGGGGFLFLFVEPRRKPQVAKLLRNFGGNVFNPHFVQAGAHSWVLPPQTP
jgi:D-glycero-alpha-D-manno-heptose-7-phosphate kinase